MVNLQLAIFIGLTLIFIAMCRTRRKPRITPEGYSEIPPGRITGIWSNGQETFELKPGPLLVDGKDVYMGKMAHNVLTFHDRVMLWDGHHAIADQRTASVFTRLGTVVPGETNACIQGLWKTRDGHDLVLRSQDLITWGFLDGAPFVAVHDQEGTLPSFRARGLTRTQNYLMSQGEDDQGPTLRLLNDHHEFVFFAV